MKKGRLIAFENNNNQKSLLSLSSFLGLVPSFNILNKTFKI